MIYSLIEIRWSPVQEALILEELVVEPITGHDAKTRWLRQWQ